MCDWGPLSHPVRQSTAEGSPPWRDNAHLSYRRGRAHGESSSFIGNR
jgi:hypothetical protein